MVDTISRTSQFSTTGVTKAVVCTILFMAWRMVTILGTVVYGFRFQQLPLLSGRVRHSGQRK